MRVADSSVMPTIVAGPIAASTMMIAEKAAHLIKRDWLSFAVPGDKGLPCEVSDLASGVKTDLEFDGAMQEKKKEAKMIA